MRGWMKAEQMKKTRSTGWKHLSELSRCLKEVASVLDIISAVY